MDSGEGGSASGPPSAFAESRPLLHLGAVAIGVLPVYTFAVAAHLTRDRSWSVGEMMIYPLVFGGGSILLILALQRYLCREPLAALNSGAGSWQRDVLEGILLTLAFLMLTIVEMLTIFRWLPQPQRHDVGHLIAALVESPLLLALWLGPVVWIGVAGFEELSRVFALERLWSVWPGRAARWAAVVAFSALFGAAHAYQGWPGIIGTALLSLLAGAYYMLRRRIWPLIVSHALYDSAWILLAVSMAQR